MTPEQTAACQRLRDKYRDRFVVTEEIDGHLWGDFFDPLIEGEFCLYCSIMRRADKQHKPCGGPRRLELRA